MAKNKKNSIGLHFEADTVDLKNGIKDIKKQLNQANKDFTQATAGMQKWADNTQGLSAKLTQLNTKLSSQEKAVDLYKKAIEEASKKEGDHSVEIENLKSKLQDAEIAVAKTTKEINYYSESLATVEANEKAANSELAKLTDTISKQEAELKGLQDEYRDAVITYGKNSKEAKALKGDIKKLSGELDGNKATVDKADKALEDLEKQFDDSADAAEDFSKGVDGIKNIGGTVAKGVAGVAAGVGALAGAFLATSESTKEYRTNMAKIETGFETSGLKAEQASETYKNLWAIVADDGKATEATAMLGQLATSQEDLNTWTNILTGVYATFGDSLPIEGLAEAALETSKTGAITGGLADALNWAGISEDEFQASLDECTTEQERQKLITDTLNKTYDEASKKYQQVNKDVIESNKSQVNLTDTMAKFGEKAEPILTVIKEGFNSILQEVLSLMENVDFEALGAQIEAGFAYFIDTIIPAIINGFQWIMDNKDLLIAGVVAIGTAMLAWNVVSIINGVVTAIKGWTTAQTALNIAMNANVIGLIVAAIAGLVAGFVVLWNKCDAFRNFWIGLWDGIKSAVSTVVDWIKNNWESLVLFMMNPFVGLFKYLYDNFEGFRNTVDNVLNKVVQFFKDCWANIKSAWSGVSTWFSGIKDTIVNTFAELPTKMLDVGKNLVEGLWNGINDMASWVSKKIKGFTDDVLGGIKKFFGIASPSKEMAKIGKFLDEGLAQGIEKGKDGVLSATNEVGQELLNSFDYLEDELAKKELGAKLDVLDLKNFEDPFEGWSLSELSNHIKTLKADLQETNMWIAENGLSQEKWGQSIESMNEYAQHLKDGYEQTNATIEALKAKLDAEGITERQKELVNADITSMQEKLKLYEDEWKNVQKAVEEFAEEANKSWKDKFLDDFSLKFKIDTSEAEAALDKLKEMGSNVYNTLKEVATQRYENEMTLLDMEQQAYDLAKDGEMAKVQELYDRQLISEETLKTCKTGNLEEIGVAEEELLAKKNKLAEKQFESEKGTSIAEAMIGAAQAIIECMKLGPVAGPIAAGVIGITTNAQIAAIKAQKYVPMLAKGGIVDNPTYAMIGEDGKEAVIPLENNTSWISELAAKISAIMQKDFSFGGVQMQPSLAGETIINNTYNYTQNITSPKSLSRKELYRDGKNLLSLKKLD